MNAKRRNGWFGVLITAMMLFCFMIFSSSAMAADYKWPKVLKIATPAMGSSAYNLNLAWANKIGEDTGMKVRLLPEESTGSKWAAVKAGRFDMMHDTYGYVAGWMMEAREGMQTQKGGPFNARVFMANMSMAFVVFTRGDTGLESVYDFPARGKDLRIIHWTIPGGIDIVQAVLAWVNMTTDDVTLIKTGSYIGSYQMIAQGKADVMMFGMPPAPAFIEANANPHGIKVIKLDPENNPAGAKRFRQYMAAYRFPKVAAGPQEFIGETGWGSDGGLFCHADMDEEFVYQMVKWTDENFDKLAPLHPYFKLYWTVKFNKQYADEAYIPLHDGFVRYLEEKGLWTVANERRQQYNVQLFKKYTRAYEEAKAMAAKQRIKINPQSDEWTNLWENHKKDLGLPRISILSDAEIREGLKNL